MPTLKANRLTHIYSIDTPFEKTALKDINLEIKEGELLAVLGHTGSGKSTFIQHLNALLQPTEGEVLLDNEDINKDKKSRHEVKFKVGLVFQYPEYQLFEETVRADIGFGPGNMGLNAEEIQSRVEKSMEFVSLDKSLLEQSPLELSGGQKRRVAIAGVIAMEPDVLILDEPTAGLDPEGSRMIIDNILEYKKETGCTVVIVSHSMDLAAEIADRIAVFSKGEVLMTGTPEEVFSKADKLIENGLNVPAPTKIAMELKKTGVDLGKPVFTHAGLMDAIIKKAEEA